MKKSKLLVAGLVVTMLIASSIVLLLSNDAIPERDDFEQFLLGSASEFDSNINTDEVKNPGMDRPDVAAYADFVKTVDPELKRVPAERLIDAYWETEQLKSYKSASDLIWTNHPTNMGGRTRVVFYDPGDADSKRVFAGSVTGGLWVNDDPVSNELWRPVDNFWPNLSVSCMASDPNNTQSIFLGTGESQTALIIYRESSTRGIGLMHSSDGGETWNLLPSTSEWAYVTDVIVRDEDGESVIYAGVISGIYKGSFHQSTPSDGLYRSDDDGQTWTQVLPQIPDTNRPYAPSEIELSSDGDRIFVGTTYHGEDRRGAACILYSDDGINWIVNSDYYNMFTEGLNVQASTRTFDQAGRVVLAAAPGNPDIIYALIAGGYLRGDGFVGYDCPLILKSEDKGVSWTMKPNIPMRDPLNTFAYLAWHALAVSVDPGNPNNLWIGGLDVWKSMDGANTWQQVSFWAPGGTEEAQSRYVHADIHMIKYKPGSTSELMIATDGGVFYTDEAQLALPRFYEKNWSFSTLQFYSGALHPDPDSRFFLGGLQDNGTLLYHGDNLPENSFKIGGGDGAYCFIDQNEPNIQFSTVYYTWLNVFDIDLSDHIRQIAGFNYSFGTFINPMDYDWRYNTIYANGTHFTGFNANKIGVIRLVGERLSGGLKDIPTDSNVPFSAIKWYEESGENASTIYLGTESGRLFRLEDAVIVGELTEITGNLPTGYISSIDLGQTEDTVLVTYSNYGVSSVWLSVDRGQTWKDIDTNIPDMPIRWGIFHPANSGQIMLGTEIGSWTTTDALAEEVSWIPDVNGMANVRVDMLRVRPADNMVLAATHGRGMFTSIWNPIFTSSIMDIASNSELLVYPNPTSGKFSVEIPDNQSVEIQILDMSGRIIRSKKIESGDANRNIEFDLDRESKGNYFVHLIGPKGSKTTRFILQ